MLHVDTYDTRETIEELARNISLSHEESSAIERVLEGQLALNAFTESLARHLPAT